MGSDPKGTFVLSALLIGLIVGAVVGATVGGVVAYNVAKNNGAEGWDLVGQTLLGILGGAVIGGAVGAAIGYIAPAISSFLGTTFSFTLPSLGALFGSSGAAAGVLVTVTGAQILQGVAGVGAFIGSLILMSKIPYHGEPNSVIQQGGSTGYYDENGNLIKRRDTTGKPHFIKKYNDYFLPHTHEYKWKLIEGIWRIIEKIIHPY